MYDQELLLQLIFSRHPRKLLCSLLIFPMYAKNSLALTSCQILTFIYYSTIRQFTLIPGFGGSNSNTKNQTAQNDTMDYYTLIS